MALRSTELEPAVPPPTAAQPELNLLRAQRSVLEGIIRGDPLPQVLAALCRIVEAQAVADVKAAILLTDSTGTCLITGAAPSLPDSYNAAVNGIGISPHVGTCCAAAARCEVILTPDIAQDPGWQGLSHLPLALGLTAAWSMPIVSSKGEVLGTFGTYFHEKRLPTDHERELVAVLSNTAALAIERDRNDAALTIGTQTLDESRARLDYAVQLSGIGFWYCDLPFDELIWDERVKGHFFLKPEDKVLIGTFYERLHPDDREPTRAAIDTSINEGRRYDVIYRTTDPSSSRFKWIRAVGGAVRDGDGNPVRFDGVTVDVTTQKMTEAKLAQLLETEQRQALQLRDQDRRKDEFLATLAHELRNPLAPIRNALQIMRMSPSGDKVATLRDMMDRQVTHLVHLIDDLLDVSRISQGKIYLRRQKISLQSAVQAATEASRPLIDENKHSLTLTLPEQALWIDADLTRIAQIVGNLLNNAAKYTPPGGDITVTAQSDNGYAVLVVADTGVGIPADMLSTVFDLFTQVDNNLDRSQGGLGIGLALVKQLIEMHDGTIEARSGGAHKGSTFTIRLPLI